MTSKSKPLLVLVLAAASIFVAEQLHRLIILTNSSSGEGMDERITQFSEGGGASTSISSKSNEQKDEWMWKPLPWSLPNVKQDQSSHDIINELENNTDKRTAQFSDGGGTPLLVSSVNNTEANESNWKPLPWSLPSANQDLNQSSDDFMNELNQLKRNMGIRLPWDSVGKRSSLPTPIISLNLPKSATLTLANYFACGGLISAHTFVPSTSVRIGDCMRENFLSDVPPFQGCDIDNKNKRVVEFYSDIGIPEPRCFYSSFHDGGLDQIAKHYPNATIIMMHREFRSWYKSIRNWGRGRLLGRWRKVCGVKGSIGTCANEDRMCWQDFYSSHTEKIREFARNHLYLTYVELQLDASSPSVLESYTGISRSCLQHCTPGKPKDLNAEQLKRHKKCKPISF